MCWPITINSNVDMSKDEQNQLSIIPGEWAVKKLLGPTLDEIGTDLQKLYSIGRDKILSVAVRKSNVNDGKKANLRVARDVFWNGSFTDEAICAEYFGDFEGIVLPTIYAQTLDEMLKRAGLKKDENNKSKSI